MSIAISLVVSDMVPQGHVVVYARESEAQIVRSLLDKLPSATKAQVAKDIGMPYPLYAQAHTRGK